MQRYHTRYHILPSEASLCKYITPAAPLKPSSHTHMPIAHTQTNTHMPQSHMPSAPPPCASNCRAPHLHVWQLHSCLSLNFLSHTCPLSVELPPASCQSPWRGQMPFFRRRWRNLGSWPSCALTQTCRCTPGTHEHEHATGTHEHALGTHEHGPGTHKHAPGTHEQAPGTHEHAPGTQEHAPGTHEETLGTHEHAPGTHEHAPDASKQLFEAHVEISTGTRK